MAGDNKHISLESLWDIARRRAKPSPKEVRHLVDCNECIRAAILCEIHKSIAKVRAALAPKMHEGLTQPEAES